MPDLSLSRLPALEPGVLMSVAIPARNEEAEIGVSLGALATQQDAPPFEIVVFANNCTDGTVERAMNVAARYPECRMQVCVDTLKPGISHVGTARKLLMDRCAERFMAAGLPQGIIASTDADTTVASDWVAQTFREMRFVDAVAGHVEIRDGDRSRMDHSMRDLYARELFYRHLRSELEASIDPVPEDPRPRHSSFVAASFAVSAGVYQRAGGLEAIPALEDRTFLQSLRRIDARVRHSLRVRAWTSGRTHSRVRGGFATFINHLHECAPVRGFYDVSDPRELLRELSLRAALRRIWNGSSDLSESELIRDTLEIGPSVYLPLIDQCSTFGLFHERVLATAPASIARPMVSLDEAIAAIEAEIADRRPYAHALPRRG